MTTKVVQKTATKRTATRTEVASVSLSLPLSTLNEMQQRKKGRRTEVTVPGLAEVERSGSEHDLRVVRVPDRAGDGDDIGGVCGRRQESQTCQSASCTSEQDPSKRARTSRTHGHGGKGKDGVDSDIRRKDEQTHKRCQTETVPTISSLRSLGGSANVRLGSSPAMKMTSQTALMGTLFLARRAKKPRSGIPLSREKAWNERALACVAVATTCSQFGASRQSSGEGENRSSRVDEVSLPGTRPCK